MINEINIYDPLVETRHTLSLPNSLLTIDHSPFIPDSYRDNHSPL